MSPALVDIVFWIVVFIVFFYGFKWLQNRKRAKREAQGDTRPHGSPPVDPASEDRRLRKERDGNSNDGESD